MKINTLYILVLLIIGTSCTKVIDVDLNESDPKIVVDAYIKYDSVLNTQIAVANLSKTANYFDNSVPEAIIDATLKVTNGTGKEFPLTYDPTIGFYANISESDFSNMWTIEGTVESTDIMSTTTIPSFIKIDSINTIKFPFGPPSEGLIPVCYFTDIAGEDNYYRLKITINGELFNDLYTSVDDSQDGKQMSYTFMGSEVFDGDEIKIELLCIDEVSYEYFKIFGDNMGGGGFSAAPGNPITNIEGENIVGIFTGQTSNVALKIRKK